MYNELHDRLEDLENNILPSKRADIENIQRKLRKYERKTEKLREDFYDIQFEENMMKLEIQRLKDVMVAMDSEPVRSDNNFEPISPIGPPPPPHNNNLESPEFSPMFANDTNNSEVISISDDSDDSDSDDSDSDDSDTNPGNPGGNKKYKTKRNTKKKSSNKKRNTKKKSSNKKRNTKKSSNKKRNTKKSYKTKRNM
jgi:hypothetical protein